MDNNQRRKELSNFLKTRRNRISPDQVGLQVGARRRTSGLRREEVAQLGGIGVTWYTWLEQGRDVQVSVTVLESIARVLQLDMDEKVHLFMLANQSLPIEQPLPRESVNPILQRAIDHMSVNPAYITGQRWDILAWNQAASLVFGDFAAMPPKELNIVWFVFMNKAFRRMLVDWEAHAKLVLAQFRASYGPHVGDPWFMELIESLKQASPEFLQWWPQHDVFGRLEGCKKLDHPKVGRLILEYVVFKAVDGSNLEVVMYMPSPETNTISKLQQLLKWNSQDYFREQRDFVGRV